MGGADFARYCGQFIGERAERIVEASVRVDAGRAHEDLLGGEDERGGRGGEFGGGLAGIVYGPRRKDTMTGVKTAIALWGDRHIPASAIAQQARALEAGGVDGMLIADQFGNFIPPQLWKPEIVPAPLAST